MHCKSNLYTDNGAQVQSVYNCNYKFTGFCGTPTPPGLLSLSQHEIRYVVTCLRCIPLRFIKQQLNTMWQEN